jgi:hypothetical protein
LPLTPGLLLTGPGQGVENPLGNFFAKIFVEKFFTLGIEDVKDVDKLR